MKLLDRIKTRAKSTWATFNDGDVDKEDVKALLFVAALFFGIGMLASSSIFTILASFLLGGAAGIMATLTND